MTQSELDAKLKLIEEAMKEADPKKQSVMMEAITDPMDSLQCDGCQ